MSAPIRQAYVSLDDVLGPYPAWVIEGHHWNGHAVPYFTFATVRRISTDLARWALDPDWSDAPVLTIADDHTVTLQSAGWEETHTEVIQPSARSLYPLAGSLYAVGENSWCWTEDDWSREVEIWVADPGTPPLLGGRVNLYTRGDLCRDCDRTYDPYYRIGVPCDDPEGHARVAVGNWRQTGNPHAIFRPALPAERVIVLARHKAIAASLNPRL